MRKLAAVSLLAVALLLTFAAPSLAGGRHRHHHHGPRVFVSVGPRFWWGPYPYPYYYYPPPYYVYTPPPVVVQEPSVYVQQQVAPSAPAAPAAPAEAYWYYCPSAGAYYPTAPTCNEPWVKVPPRQE
jgi:hypothetical protein